MRQSRILLVFSFLMLMISWGCFREGKRVNPVDPKSVYHQTVTPTVIPVGPVGNPNAYPGAEIGVSALPVTIVGNTTGATDEATDCFGIGGVDHIYSFRLLSTTDITVNLCYSGYDTLLVVGTSYGDNSLGCSDDGGCGGLILTSSLSFASLSAGTYYVSVDGSGGDTGPYVLIISSP
jgi:hypothetical protein